MRKRHPEGPPEERLPLLEGHILAFGLEGLRCLSICFSRKLGFLGSWDLSWAGWPGLGLGAGLGGWARPASEGEGWVAG